MQHPDPNTEAFRYWRRIFSELVEKITFSASHARNDDWLSEAVQKVASVDPDITDDMVLEAMRIAIGQYREMLALNESMNDEWRAVFCKTNERIERALHEFRHVEVMASPEIAALLSRVVLPFKPRPFKPRHTAG